MTSVPPVTSTPAPAPAQGGGAGTGDAAQGQVTSLPPSLADTGRTLVLRGEVQNVDTRSGTVTITTPRGPVDVKLPEPLPQTGQRVEITLPAGSPPTEASVRAVQTQAQPLPQQPLPQMPLPATGGPATAQTPIPLPSTAGIVAQPASAPGGGTTLPATALLQQEGTQIPSSMTPAPERGNTTTQNQISPQGLLNFLKTSLQNALQLPHTGNVLGAQRPLQQGQLVRLLPVGGQVQAPASSQTLWSQSGPVATLQGMALMSSLKAGALPATHASLQIPILTQRPSAPASVIVADDHPLARILQPLFGALNADALTRTGAISTQMQMQMQTQNGLMSVLKNLMGHMQTPQTTQTVATGAVFLPPMRVPVIDARLMATLPVVQQAAAQNPGIANLLHGTPAMPALFAQVAGQTAQGLPVIEMPVFNGDAQPKTVAMTLQFPTRAMAPGTWIHMDVMQTATAASATGMTNMLPIAGLDGLDDLFTALRALPDGQAVLQMAQSAMPRPGAAAFTAPVLMFLAAARGGDVTAWLGERTVDNMRNIRRADILSRIGSAMNTTAARMREDAAQSGEWKTISLPILASESQIAQIAMHYRSFEREHDDTPNQERQKGARFVMDLSLTRIGPLQIDGLSVGRQLDVTLRSEQAFSTSMREALRARYTDALGGIGFSGQLNFKADGDHKGWVDFRKTDTPRAAARA